MKWVLVALSYSAAPGLEGVIVYMAVPILGIPGGNSDPVPGTSDVRGENSIHGGRARMGTQVFSLMLI